MAIQNRRGAYANLDKTKLLPGEFAICTDNGKLYYCCSAGNVQEVVTIASLQDILGASPEAYAALQELIGSLSNGSVEAQILNAISSLQTGKLDASKVVFNQSTTEAGFAADARQLNPSEDGSFAYNVNHSVSGADLIVEESVVSGRGVILEKKNNEIKFSGYYTMPVTSAQVKVGTLPKGYRVRVNKYVPVAIRRDTAYNTGYLALATDGSFYVRGATGTEFYFDTCYNIL